MPCLGRGQGVAGGAEPRGGSEGQGQGTGPDPPFYFWLAPPAAGRLQVVLIRVWLGCWLSVLTSAFSRESHQLWLLWPHELLAQVSAAINAFAGIWELGRDVKRKRRVNNTQLKCREAASSHNQ